jgi:hypothetical protein
MWAEGDRVAMVLGWPFDGIWDIWAIWGHMVAGRVPGFFLLFFAWRHGT